DFFKFYVIRDDAVNAFTHLGGHIYFTDTILNAYRKSDAGLLFVLAHEMAHNVLKHVERNTTKQIRAYQVGQDVGALMASMYSEFVAIGFSSDQELKSDEWAYRVIVGNLGYSRREALEGLYILAAATGQNIKPDGLAPGREKTIGEAITREIGHHFSSHPDMGDRIERLKELTL
ncbi:MAG: M48 family metalloprotease, partial [Verrucomicrobiota bacterium]